MPQKPLMGESVWAPFNTILLGSLVLSKRRTSNKVVCIHTDTRSMLLYSLT